MIGNSGANFSRRLKDFPSSPIRKLVKYADEAKKRGKEVYHLNIGQPDIPAPDYALKNFAYRIPEVVAYTHSYGLEDLRRLWAEYYKDIGIDIDYSNLVVTTGGSEAIMFALFSIADFGDNAIVFEPVYTNYLGFAEFCGVELRAYPLDVRNGFHFDNLNGMEKLVDSKTRAIIVVNPNNPTGVVLSREEVELIVEFARRHNLWIIADEVYKEFVFEGDFVSFLSTGYEKVIVVDSLSKLFSMCGARVGALVSHVREILEGVLKLGQARLCPPLLGQLLAIEVFKDKDSYRKYLKQVKDEYRLRRDVVWQESEGSSEIKIYKKPEGAFYVVAALDVENAEEFAKWMLTDFDRDGRTVMVAPAAGFYVSDRGKDEVRIAYVLNSDKLRNAIKILKEGVRVYKNRG